MTPVAARPLRRDRYGRPSAIGAGPVGRSARRRGRGRSGRAGMRLRRRAAWVLSGTAAVAAVGLPLAGPAAAQPRAVAPRVGEAEAGATTEWLAPAVRVGRNELQIARIRSARSPAALLDELTADWQRRAAPVQRVAEGGWLVAIQADGEWVETVRVHPDGDGAAGLRIRQRLAPVERTAALDPVDQLLAGARVINRTDQQEGDRRITSFVVVSEAGPAALLARARTEGRRHGFVDDVIGNPPDGPLWLRRRADEIVISATPAPTGTVAVLHWSRKP